MFKKEKFDLLKEMEKAGFVMCEHTKLWGLKDDMVQKIVVRNRYVGYLGNMPVAYPVYYSPAFAPEWQKADFSGDKPRYTKIIKGEDKVVEVKVK